MLHIWRIDHLVHPIKATGGWKKSPPLTIKLALGGVLLAATILACASFPEPDQPRPGSRTESPTPLADASNSLGLPLQIPQDPAALYRYSEISVGDDHSCGLLTSGEVLCWGSNRIPFGHFVGQSQPPPGKFVDIDAGYAHTCGVRNDGTVECWGSNLDDWNEVSGQSMPPPGKFRTVSAGKFHTCGVRTDNKVMCWGSNKEDFGDDVGQSRPPEGEFLSVSAGDWHSCGIKVDGSVECWGSNYASNKTDGGQLRPPEGEFTSLVSGTYHSCAIAVGRFVECWGALGYFHAPERQGHTLTFLDSGMGQVCSLYSDGKLICGNAGYGWGIEYTGVPDERFSSVSSYRDHSCGVLQDGTARCWGNNSFGKASPPEAGGFRAVSVGRENVCAIRHDGQLECWGEYYNDYLGRELHSWEISLAIPEGRFKGVSVNDFGSCAVRDDNALVCWETWESPGGEVIGEDFLEIGNGSEARCGLRLDGGVQCWDYGTGGGIYPDEERIKINEVTPAGKVFVSVSVGTRHACGLRYDHTVECWGDNYSYYAYCTGGNNGGMPLCGLEARGDYLGQAESPEGHFTSVSAGSLHTCGLRFNGEVECWGADFGGQSTPPDNAGPFVSISAGYAHTCGIRLDGSVQCWGSGLTELAASTGPINNMIPDWRAGEDFVTVAPDLPFASISAGDGFTCGIVTDGTLKCWGRTTR